MDAVYVMMQLQQREQRSRASLLMLDALLDTLLVQLVSVIPCLRALLVFSHCLPLFARFQILKINPNESPWRICRATNGRNTRSTAS
jgi:hypothetical protein